MEPWRAIAARNNAAWCDTVCRSHGAETRFDEVAWTSSTRTPAYYPDAVTLVPDLSVPGLLARIDSSVGCSIKDSFASLDLTGHGFRVLFDAQWIVSPDARHRAKAVSSAWELLRDREDIAMWIEAWREDESPTDVLLPDVLAHESVAVLAARRYGRLVAGAIAARSADAVGISNFFAEQDITAASWSGCLALARFLFPGSPLVGYESGDQLTAARVANAIVGEHLEISIGEQLVRRHKVKHDRTREHGAVTPTIRQTRSHRPQCLGWRHFGGA